MARLPVPGQDDGTWGDILNQFLLVAHDANGAIKAGAAPTAMADLTDTAIDTPADGDILRYVDSSAKWGTSNVVSNLETIVQDFGFTAGQIGGGTNTGYPSAIYMPSGTSIYSHDNNDNNDYDILSAGGGVTTLRAASSGLRLEMVDGTTLFMSDNNNLSPISNQRYVDFNTNVVTNVASPETKNDVGSMRATSDAVRFSAPSAFGPYLWNRFFDNGSALQGDVCFLQANRVYLVPFSVGHDGFMLDTMGAFIPTGQEVVGAELYYAIYESVGDSSVPAGDPISSTQDASDASSAGFVSGGLGGNLLPGRMYWLAVGTGVVAPVVLSCDSFYVPRLGLVSINGPEFYSTLSQPWTPGNFPTWSFNMNQRTHLNETAPNLRMASIAT